MIIAIDFDGTCVKHEYPRVGEDIGAQPVLNGLIQAGHSLILYTMRSGKELDDAVAWFKKNGIKLYAVQEDPLQKRWTSSPKCHANLYIDDAALGIPLKSPLSGERPFVDWLKTKTMLEQRGIL